MKKQFATSLFLLLSGLISLFAQITVQGKIVNEKGAALPFASVALLGAKDSALIKGGLTDEAGMYSIPSVASGLYRIMVSSVGYDKTYTQAFTIKEDNRSATIDVSLKEATQVLKEAVVTAVRPLFEQKADRLVMNVANSPVAAGGTVMEILQKMPGVIVAQEKITLAGNQNVQIWIDGKPSQYTDVNQVLRDMPGDQIDRIELIRQPGAQFDAAGGPVLNIILKRNADLGFNGNLSLTVGGSTYDQTDVGQGQENYHRLSPSVNLNYRSGKVNLFGSYSYGNREVFTIMNVQRYIGVETYQQYNYMRIPVNFQNYRVGMDYYATKKTTVGFLLRGWSRTSMSNATNVTDVFTKDLSRKLNSFVTDNTTDSKKSGYATNVNIKHEFDAKKGHYINFDIDYNRFNTRDINDLSIYKNETSSTKSFSKQDLDQPVDLWVGKLDYSLPLDSTLKLDIGAKSTFATIDNNLQFSRSGILVAGQSTQFLYKENINAGYVSLNKKVKKFEFNAGLRAEQTVVDGSIKGTTILDRNYLQWFPSASILYHLPKPKGLGVQASYAKRVNRPGFQQQNPISFFIDSLTFTQGNPKLLPEIMHTGQLGLVFNGQPFVNVSYTKVNDVIIENAPRLEGTKTFTTAANLATQEKWEFQVNAPLKFKKLFEGYIGNQLIYNSYDAIWENADYKQSRWYWMAYMGGTMTLPKNIKIEINGWYMTKFLEEFITLKPMGGLSIGASKTFWDKRGRLSLNVNDIFYSQNSRAEIDFQAVKVAFQQRQDSRNIRLTFSYSFGSQTVKNARRRSTGSETETSRIKIE